MPTLGRALPRYGSGRECIPLDQGHFLEVICENASGEEASYTPAGNDGMAKWMTDHGDVPRLPMKPTPSHQSRPL